MKLIEIGLHEELDFFIIEFIFSLLLNIAALFFEIGLKILQIRVFE